MYRLINRRRQGGIGLLELMLSLAIIAILLIMATRYYQTASDQNKRNQAVDMFSAVNGAVQAYKIDNDITNLSGIIDLVNDGYLPPNYGSGTSANPWGGKIGLTAIGTAGTFTVTMDAVPKNSCGPTADRVNSTIARTTGSTVGATCPTSGTSIIAIYNM